MSDTSATIVGGQHVTLTLNPNEYHKAKDALAAIGAGYRSGEVLHSTADSPVPGALNVYDIVGDEGQTYSLNPGAQGLVVDGTADVGITGHSSGPELLVGDQGNDTINAAGGNGTIIAGDGEAIS